MWLKPRFAPLPAVKTDGLTLAHRFFWFKAWCAMQNLSDADEALNALLLVILQSGLTFNYIADNFDDALFRYISPLYKTYSNLLKQVKKT